jgi:PAS domain-containing protein
MRHLASYLAVPIFIVDSTGTLVYYNEAAESILGRPFGDVEEMSPERWYASFSPTDESGAPVPLLDTPLMVAALRHHPVHAIGRIMGLDGVWRHIAITSFPLIGIGIRHVGAVALFWETSH